MKENIEIKIPQTEQEIKDILDNKRQQEVKLITNLEHYKEFDKSFDKSFDEVINKLLEEGWEIKFIGGNEISLTYILFIRDKKI